MTTMNPDFDGDGVVSVLDYATFQNLFAAGDMRADFTGDGQLNVLDFAAFQNAAAAFGAGWSKPVPSADTRLIYVHPSGDDANDGLSAATPMRSINAAVGKLRPNKPDWLLLARGGAWFDDPAYLSWKSGRSAYERLHIGSYGDQSLPRPQLGTAPGKAAVVLNGANFIELFDLDILGPLGYPASSPGLFGLGAQDILIENCRVKGTSGAVAFMGDPGQNRRSARIKLRRCVLVGAGSVDGRASEVLLGESDGVVLEDCYMLRGGRGLGFGPTYAAGLSPSIFSHNVYVNGDNRNSTDITISGCLVAYASQNALRCCGTKCEDNYLFNNPGGIITVGITESVRHNVIDGCIDVGPGLPFGCIGGGFVALNAVVQGNVAIRGGSSGNVSGWTFQGDYGGLVFNGNVVKGWIQAINADAYAIRLDGTPSVTAYFTGNAFDQVGGRIVNRTERDAPLGMEVWSGNLHRSNSPQGAFMVTKWGYCGFDAWSAAMGEVGSRWLVVADGDPFVDSTRCLDTYAKTISGLWTADELLTACESQERGRWDIRLEPRRISAWVRAGFAIRQGVFVP